MLDQLQSRDAIDGGLLAAHLEEDALGLRIDDPVFVVVLNERAQLVAVLEHEHLAGILHAERFVGHFRAGSNVLAHRVGDVAHEHVEEGMRQLGRSSARRLQDGVVVADEELLFHEHGERDLRPLQVILGQQLQLAVEIRQTIVHQQQH
eukprot:scaffold655_cov225-Pinguiococcus_pyrenoidosus.AAC.16